MKITAGTMTQYQDIGAGATLMNLPYEILNDDGSVASEGNQSFPLTVTEEEVTGFLTTKLAVFKENTARFEATQEHQANLDSASAVADKVSGLSVSD